MSEAPAEKRRAGRNKIIPFGQHSEQFPAFSDDALALRFAELHARDLRYVADGPNGCDGRRALAVRRHACRIRPCARGLPGAAAECNKPKLAKDLASAKTVAAVERLASPIAGSRNGRQWDPTGC